MALKALRQVDVYEVGFFMNEVSDPGFVVSVKTAGSGTSLDNTNSVCTVAAVGSGNKPIGVLLDQVVNIDLTRFPINWHKQQAASGDKVSIARKGFVVTNAISAPSVNAGDFAVLTNAGNVSGVAPGAAWNEAATPKVGRWASSKDSDGYARLYVDL